MIGKTRLYNHLPPRFKKEVPQILLSDTQWNAVAKGYYSDPHFKANGNQSINGWNLYNLLTGSNKSSYIDTFLERAHSCQNFVTMLSDSKSLNKFNWYLN